MTAVLLGLAPTSMLTSTQSRVFRPAPFLHLPDTHTPTPPTPTPSCAHTISPSSSAAAAPSSAAAPCSWRCTTAVHNCFLISSLLFATTLTTFRVLRMSISLPSRGQTLLLTDFTELLEPLAAADLSRLSLFFYSVFLRLLFLDTISCLSPKQYPSPRFSLAVSFLLLMTERPHYFRFLPRSAGILFRVDGCF